MKRSFVLPFLSALVGGGIVVAVIAALGGLGATKKTVTEIQEAAPLPAASTTSGEGGGKTASLPTAHEIYERNAPGVVFVTSTIVRKTESPFGISPEGEEQGTATGSGIVIDNNGTILTNWHVVENAVKVTVSFESSNEQSKTVTARVVGKDPSNDLAVLKVPTEGIALHPLTLGDSSNVEVGEPVYAIGNPFDLNRTLTTGVISALQRQITAPNGFKIDNVLQTDAPINPGNSGGPLLEARGRVIGINSQIETGGGGSDGNVGIGFAIPINTAKKELPELEKGGTLKKGYLGVEALTINNTLSSLNLPVKTEVVIDGGKLEAGGDIVVGIDGQKVESSEDLARDIEPKKPGESISIELLHASGGGNYTKKTIKVTLTTRPNSIPSSEIPE
jgi:S1-C subfamily serine protease